MNNKFCVDKKYLSVFLLIFFLLIGITVFWKLQSINLNSNSRADEINPTFKPIQTQNSLINYDLEANLLITLQDESGNVPEITNSTFVNPVILIKNKYFFEVNIIPLNNVNKKIPLFCDFIDNGQPYNQESLIRPTFYIDPYKIKAQNMVTLPYQPQLQSKGTHVFTITCDGGNFGDRIIFYPSKSRSFLFTIN